MLTTEEDPIMQMILQTPTQAWSPHTPEGPDVHEGRDDHVHEGAKSLLDPNELLKVLVISAGFFSFIAVVG